MAEPVTRSRASGYAHKSARSRNDSPTPGAVPEAVPPAASEVIPHTTSDVISRVVSFTVLIAAPDVVSVVA